MTCGTSSSPIIVFHNNIIHDVSEDALESAQFARLYPARGNVSQRLHRIVLVQVTIDDSMFFLNISNDSKVRCSNFLIARILTCTSGFNMFDLFNMQLRPGVGLSSYISCHANEMFSAAYCIHCHTVGHDTGISQSLSRKQHRKSY